jgi:hypothetical protein
LPKLKSFLEKQEKERTQELSKLQIVKSNEKSAKDIKDTKDIQNTKNVTDVINKEQKPDTTKPIPTEKEKSFTDEESTEEEFPSMIKIETRWSIQLQRTYWDKFKAAC